MRRHRLDTLCFRCGRPAHGHLDRKGHLTCEACLARSSPRARTAIDSPDELPNAPADAACRACGYDLSGLEAPHCPECGCEFHPPTASPTLPLPRTAVPLERPTYEVLQSDAATPSRAPCPCCHASMMPGQVRCAQCGTLPAVYTVLADRGDSRPVPLECRECGYDLRGLTRPICPECGATRNPSTSMSDAGSMSSREQAMHVRRVLMISAISSCSLLGLLLLTRSLSAAGSALLALPLHVLLASTGFWFSSAWLSRDPPWWLVLVRMLAIVPSALILPATLSTTGLPAASWVGSASGTAVFWFMVAELFDLEAEDCGLVLAVNCVLWLVLQTIFLWLL